MNLIDEINKVKEESYEKWFERWYKNSNLENKILQAAQEGYSGYQLSIKRTYDSESNWDKKRAYKARRMRDKRTVENIKNKLGEGLKVKHVSKKIRRKINRHDDYKNGRLYLYQLGGETMTNMVNKPSHYIGVNGMEVEEVLQNFLPKYKDPYMSHRVGSAIEYQLRAPGKNGLEDLKKARKNLDQAIEYAERKKIESKGSQQGNELNSFLRSLSDMPKQDKWVDRLVPGMKVSTYYAGTNPLD